MEYAILERARGRFTLSSFSCLALSICPALAIVLEARPAAFGLADNDDIVNESRLLLPNVPRLPFVVLACLRVLP